MENSLGERTIQEGAKKTATSRMTALRRIKQLGQAVPPMKSLLKKQRQARPWTSSTRWVPARMSH